MNVRKSDDFIADVERQSEWYAVNAGWLVADLYLTAVEASCERIARHPFLGPLAGLTHPRLRDWRFFVVLRPFHKHIIFYEPAGEEVVLYRTLHGHRDLPRRLVEPPGAE